MNKNRYQYSPVKDEYKKAILYYAKVLLISFIPIAIICNFIYPKVNTFYQWLITLVFVLISLLIGMLIRPHLKNKKQESLNKYDPYKK